MATEFVGIELQLRGEEGVKADLQQIDKLLHSLGGRKKVDAGMKELKRDIVAARGELEKYQRLRQSYKDAGGKGNAYVKEIQEARYHLRDLQQAQREVNVAAREMGKTFMQTFNSYSSRIAHLGSSMQSLGNAMVRLTSPFTRLATGMLYGAGFSAINKFTEGFSRGFERYDIMKKYPKVMAAFGYSAEQSQKSIEALDKSVRGLPTGLDEMVDLTQRFTATTGDLEKGTKLAIATNNAFLASMTTDTQKYQGMMQLQDVLGGKDMTSKEWNSLVSSMTPAIVKMGEFMKEQGKWSGSVGEFVQHVRDGKMANQDFVKSLIAIGNEGGVLEAMAQNAKDTWAAFFANVGNASARMTEGIIKAFDEITQQLYGKDLNMLFIDNIIPAIDKLAESVRNWIKANPDKIIDFVNKLKSIDLKGFATGLVKGFGEMATFLSNITSFLGKGGLEGFGKWMIRLNMIGKGLLVVGGAIKGLRIPLAFIGTLANWGAKGGILGRLADLIGVGGAGSTAMKTADKIEDAVPVLTRTSTGLSRFFKAWGQIATMIGGSAFVAWGSVKLFKGAFKDLKEIGDIIADTDWKHAKWGLIGMGGFIGGLSTLSVVLRKALGGTGGLKTLAAGGVLAGLTMMFSGAFWADMEMVKRGLKALSEAVGMINGIIDDISTIKQVGSVSTGKIQNAIDAFNLVTRLFNGDAEVDSTKGGTGGGQFSGVSQQIKQKNEGLLLFKKSFTESLKNMKDALGYMKDISKLLDKVNKLDFNTDNIQDVADRIGTALGHIGRMIERIPESLKTEETKTVTGILKASIDNVKQTFDTIVGKGGLLSQFKDFNKKLQDLVKNGEFTELQTNMDTLATNLSQVWKKLDFVNYAPDGETPSEEDIRAGAAEKFSKGGKLDTSNLTNPTEMILKQVQNLSQAMTEIGSIIQTIQDINQVEGLQEALDTVIGEDGVISQIQGMYTSLVDTETGFGKGADLNLGEIAGGFATAIGSIKDAITTLQEIEAIEFESEGGMSAIVTEITTMVEQLTQAFSPDAIGGLVQQVQAFTLQLTSLKTQIESLGGEGGGINIAIDISHEITGDDETVQDLNDAYTSIKAEIDAIKKLSGAINLVIPISVSITGVDAAVAEMNAAASRLRFAKANLRSASGGIGVHTGGYIGSRGVQYRASGGSIFRKRGSDTVPAMLTPGEYVQNRRAVDFFGIDFMRKVNQLDVRGAMSELMAKAGSMAGASRGTVVNNTYNNNQKVVINGADVSNAGYTFKKASRFVGAL